MKEIHFNAKDITQLCQHGLTKEAVYAQLKLFEEGIPFVKLAQAAVVNNGILQLNARERDSFVKRYNQSKASTVKFVPASGSATRMFKQLHQFLDCYDPKQYELADFLQQEAFYSLKPFFAHFEKLPFCDLVKNQLNATAKNQEISTDQAKYEYVKILLHRLEYSSLPKGLIPFHHYPNRTATAFEEHLYEAADYAVNEGRAHLHFTVAEKPLSQFEAAFAEIKSRVEQKTGVSFDLTYSFQHNSTDTIAVKDDNQPFRDEDGRLFFRPGGHGALIQNLNAIEADIIYIKNIDNVVTENNLLLMTNYKKVLGGMLISAQEKIFSLLRFIDEQGFVEESAQRATALADELFNRNKEFCTVEEIKSFFNRPLRVCGMVENRDEPGGGPFWIEDEDRTVSLQIVERAQIDTSDAAQQKILQDSTHFNPVDLACGVKDYCGNKFDLNDFVNANKGFIAHKSKHGQPLKALELPGLWNGGMGHWNSIFVEVPLATFNPVKTVTDLLKPGHQPKMVAEQR